MSMGTLPRPWFSHQVDASWHIPSARARSCSTYALPTQSGGRDRVKFDVACWSSTVVGGDAKIAPRECRRLSLRAKRSNPDYFRGDGLDCSVAALLAMTRVVVG